MIPVEEALKIINHNTDTLELVNCSLLKSLGHVLAEPVFSPIDMPPFNQSAMDGYALNFNNAILSYAIIGEIAAGSNQQFELKAGEAVRIFTGGAVPESANTVIPQELVIRNENSVLIKEFWLNKNIRLKGEQIIKGELALEINTHLTPAAIGFLATLGITSIPVFRFPEIGLLTTGNELVNPGNELKQGQIFESNSIMLESVLNKYGFKLNTSEKATDSLSETIAKISSLIKEHDVVFISGGISVGDYDYVKTALETIGVKELFHKVKQKPGKPFYFGTLNKKLIFALPGNPASALTCFYIYALPALNKLCGKNFNGLRLIKQKMKTAYQKNKGMTHFLKAYSDNNLVSVLDSQSSAMLNSFSVSNALVMIPENKDEIVSGDWVDVYLLD